MSDAGSAAGEVGGALAGVVALLYAMGKGFAWFLNWNEARASTRSVKLDKWHDELEEREKALDARINERMSSFEQQVAELGRAANKWRMAFHLVAAELLQRNPQSIALMQAQKILAEEFPLSLADMTVPVDMQDAMAALDKVPTVTG